MLEMVSIVKLEDAIMEHLEKANLMIVKVRSHKYSWLALQFQQIKWGAFSRWSFGPNPARGSIVSTTIHTTHPSLCYPKWIYNDQYHRHSWQQRKYLTCSYFYFLTINWYAWRNLHCFFNGWMFWKVAVILVWTEIKMGTTNYVSDQGAPNVEHVQCSNIF